MKTLIALFTFAQLAAIPSPTPPLTLTPAATSQPPLAGIACVDVDHDRRCNPSEPRVPGVILRVDDVTSSSDSAGRFTVAAARGDVIEVELPDGYTDATGAARIQVFAADALDVPLAFKVAAAPVAATTPVVVNVSVPQQPDHSLIGWGIGAFFAAVTALMWRGMHRVQSATLSLQGAMLNDQHDRFLFAQLQQPNGWSFVLGQVAADALREPVSIDLATGILNAASEPLPHFTVTDLRGQQLTFVALRGLKAAKQFAHLFNGERMIRVSPLSPTSHRDVRGVWEYIAADRNLPHVMLPEPGKNAAHAFTWHLMTKSKPRFGFIPQGPVIRVKAPSYKALPVPNEEAAPHG